MRTWICPKCGDSIPAGYLCERCNIQEYDTPKQRDCPHKNISDRRHLGMGLYGWSCFDCGKKFSVFEMC
jgi:hypothetical protein